MYHICNIVSVLTPVPSGHMGRDLHRPGQDDQCPRVRQVRRVSKRGRHAEGDVKIYQ